MVLKEGGAANADDTVSIHVENETPTRGTEATEKVSRKRTLEYIF